METVYGISRADAPVGLLAGLGITALWLAPFQPFPCKDDGYDVADYYGVNPRYGPLGDFVEFTRACEQRGMRVPSISS
jgi:maltose alpha-D-glucosyltransferase/alpha-amylase